MLVSMKWLETLVDVPDSLDGFCDRLDLTGTGVEGTTRIGEGLDGVVIGRVVSCEMHPDSDHMHVCMVDLGEAGDGEPVQIVCGAPNVREGLTVAVATVGTVLPGDVKIKKSKLRGVVSAGMICSERELGVGGDQEGIMELPDDAPVGRPFSEWRGMTDTVLDLEVTPNRPDCLSMRGFAREVGAMYHVPWHYEPPCEVPGPQNDEDVADIVSVEIDEPAICPRYTARVIRDVKIGPSPAWLAERITALGARPINNVVDVTNYILFELGQPLHAFDLRAFPVADDGKHHVLVRRARPEDGATFTTLDGNERELTDDMTLITDGSRPVALAGVMGGLESEVTDDTTDILLESATFEPGRTSRTSRNLSLVSEASLRYERGVDAATCDEFGEIAAALIASVAGGTVCRGVVDVYPLPAEPVELALRPDRLRAHVGADITDEEQVRILTDLGCEVTAATDSAGAAGADAGSEGAAGGSDAAGGSEGGGSQGGAAYRVMAPTYRPDLTREIDLYEEVLRIWGMDRVDSTLPAGSHAGGRTLGQRRTRVIDSTLRAAGLNETMTYSLVPADDLSRARIPADGRGEAVELVNPMSAEQSVMRRSILPGLLRSVAYNQAHGVSNVQLFERGVVFGAAEGRQSPRERELVCGVLAGSWQDAGWNSPAIELDFFDAKGVVEALARELCIPKLHFKAYEDGGSGAAGSEAAGPGEGDGSGVAGSGEGGSGETAGAPWLQPGRAAEVLAGGRSLGWVGEVHPLAAAAFDVEGSVAAFELSVPQLLASATPQRPYTDVPAYPSVELDLAIVVDEDVTAERVTRAIESAGKKGPFESVRLFDVYRDPIRVGPHKKSLALRLTYRAKDATLTSEEAEAAHERIVSKVMKATGGEVRS